MSHPSPSSSRMNWQAALTQLDLSDLILMVSNAPGRSGAAAHAQIVAKKARQRALIKAAKELEEAGYEGDCAAESMALRMLHEVRPTSVDRSLAVEAIDWSTFWNTEVADPEYVIEPFFAAGRQTAIFSMAKIGKSLLTLDMVAAAVTGRSVLGAAPSSPKRVIYVDMEMTEADLRERLVDLGYGPDDDFSRLAYFQLPSLPPLDSDLGGEVMAQLAVAHGADLVIIDTMARVVVGDENSADTYRAFYGHTGLRLKQLGIALGRLDHMGKEAAKDQRGSSAKADDVDTVYKLTAADSTHLLLKRTHSRVPWMAPEVHLVRYEEPHLSHVIAEAVWPEGTARVAELLDELGVPLDATATAATAALKEVGPGCRKVTILAALKFRRSQAT